MLTIHDPQTLWWIAGAALALLIALILVLRARAAEARRRDRHRAPDVLDEGAAPAARNSALIAAPSAVARVSAAGLADTGVDIIGGIGPIIAAAAGAEAAAAAPPAAVPSPSPDPTGDDLGRIKGIGPKLRARLAELGVTRFAQIAAWTAADIATVDAQLGAFAGRAVRDGWVEQARLLAAGDVAGYEARFGKL